MKKCMSFLFFGLMVSIYSINALTAWETKKVGQWIFFNEAFGKKELLVYWNKKEPFPSFGIGHCIWHLAGQQGEFQEQFPALCAYLQKHKVVLPAWLVKALKKGAPWKSRQEFLSDTKRQKDLLNLLESTIDLQTQFMINRLQERLPIIVQAAPARYRKKVQSHIKLLQSSLMGTYTLIDYLNFKGSGLSKLADGSPQYWGLLYVLMSIPNHVNKDTILKAFTLFAGKALLKRMEKSASQYDQVKFFSGWMKRVSTYSDRSLLP